jgi:hypothetical protein
MNHNPWNPPENKTNTTSVNGGIGFSGLLFIVFLVMKLIHIIDWSWWWITAPLWIPFVLVILFFVIILMVARSTWID